MLLNPRPQWDRHEQEHYQRHQTNEKCEWGGEIDAKGCVQKIGVGTRQSKRDSNGQQGQWELNATLAVPEPFAPMHPGNRYQHGADNQECSSWCEQTECEEQTSEKLSQGHDHCSPCCRVKPQARQELARSSYPMAPEDPKEFLCSVSKKDQSKDQS